MAPDGSGGPSALDDTIRIRMAAMMLPPVPWRTPGPIGISNAMHSADPQAEVLPFPLAVQVSSSLLPQYRPRQGHRRIARPHSGRTMMVCEGKVKDESGRLLCTVTTTHLIVKR